MMDVELKRRYSMAMRAGMGKLAGEFQHNPFDFLYESDLRSLLLHHLREELAEVRLPLSNEAINRFKLNAHCGSKTPVYSEYPTGTRFDIALTGLDDQRGLWMQPAEAAIEIKLWQVDGTGHGVMGDIEKLINYRKVSKESRGLSADFAGHSVLFCHPGKDWRRLLPTVLSNMEGAPLFPEDGIYFHVISKTEWVCCNAEAVSWSTGKGD